MSRVWLEEPGPRRDDDSEALDSLEGTGFSIQRLLFKTKLL
jgi:hypothetical protein